MKNSVSIFGVGVEPADNRPPTYFMLLEPPQTHDAFYTKCKLLDQGVPSVQTLIRPRRNNNSTITAWTGVMRLS